MRTLLLFLFVLTLHNLALGHNDPVRNSAILVRTYPKMNNSILHRHLILNRRYRKTAPERKIFTKQGNNDLTYTVFPPVPPGQKHANLPDSPFFPLPGNIEQKHRVKKVLPEYSWKAFSRRKRSPEKAKSKKNNKPKTEKKNNKNKKEVETTTEKEEVETTTAKKEDITTKAKKDVARKKDKTTVASKKNTKLPVKKSVLKTAKSKSKSRKGKIKAHKRKSHRRAPLKGKAKHKGRIDTDERKARRRRHRKSAAYNRKHQDGDARRLIAARDASIENYPYTVSIQKAGEHWCSGALLNQRLVITTANCVWKSQGSTQMQVRVGSRYVDREGQEARIQEVVKHPNWSIRKNPDNDVALLFLDRYIQFSHGVHAVDLPNRVMLPIFDDVWVTSYGADRRDGIYERPGMTLQVYHSRLMDRDKCNNITKRFGVTVSENFICLAQTSKRAPCTRDTGAPAVSDGVLWGLASWGIRKLCGTERFPAMFSFMASQTNMDFIMSATTKLMSEPRPIPYPDRYVVGDFSPPVQSQMDIYKSQV